MAHQAARATHVQAAAKSPIGAEPAAAPTTKLHAASIPSGNTVAHGPGAGEGGESVHTRAVYRYHPLFAGADFTWHYGDTDAKHMLATVEGGDVHVLGNGAGMIGMGERTTPMAVELLAQALFRGGQVHTVIAVEQAA